jgi:hypothetical protein
MMLDFVRASGRASERKALLFAVGSCRRIWHLLEDERSRRAVEVVERFVDGLVADDEVDDARENSADASGAAYRAATDAGWSAASWTANAAANAAYCVFFFVWDWPSDHRLIEAHIWAARAAAGTDVEGTPSETARPDGLKTESWEQCALLRDIFGNPFRPLPALPGSLLSWNDGLVPRLARSAYDERHLPSGHLDQDRLAVVADALVDAGCDDAELLGHLRGSDIHVRGCWALDTILGKG